MMASNSLWKQLEGNSGLRQTHTIPEEGLGLSVLSVLAGVLPGFF